MISSTDLMNKRKGRIGIIFSAIIMCCLIILFINTDLYSKAIPQTKSVEEMETALGYTPFEKFFGTGPIPQGFGFGPSISYCVTEKSKHKGYSANLDLSYSIWLFTPSINFKYLNLRNTSYYGAQFEACIFILLNVGGGAGYLWGGRPGPVYHIFIGAPFPLPLSDKDGKPYTAIDMSPLHVFYFEPYLRINFIKKETVFEIGLLMKFNTLPVSEFMSGR
jgi:hypothetical protein